MNLTSKNPNTLEYYLEYIFFLAMAYALIMLIQNIVKNRNLEKENLNLTMDYYGAHGITQVQHDVLTKEQKETRFKYLLASVVIKAASWVRAPYVFAIYNRIHGFTRNEIGYLYAVDNTTALLLGPLMGSLCDLYGRKRFTVIYCLCIVLHVSLVVTGSRQLAWVAQIVSGLSSCIMDSAFESWINFEAKGLFEGQKSEQMKNSYLREIFTKQITLDCFCSLVLTGTGTLLYLHYGILYPFYVSFLLTIVAALVISFTWDENNMELLTEMSRLQAECEEDLGFKQKIHSAWVELRRNMPLLCVGGIESCFKISLQLFLFIWTPLLEETIGTYVHPGAIYACFMLARLIGAEAFEFLKIILATNTYLVSIILTTTSCICFFLAYHIFNFDTRLLVFVYWDGISGIFAPLFSSLRAQMITESNRSTIMNFFRIPINICSIICLVLTSYVTTYQICGIILCIMIVATILNVYLFCVHSPPDAMKRKIVKTSEYQLFKAGTKQLQINI